MTVNKRLFKWTVLILTIFVVLLLSFNMYQAGWLWPAKRVVKSPEMGNRILIIAPHPDDETLAMGGIIQQALKSGKKVQVVVVTSGDGFSKAVTENYGIKSPKPEDYQRLGIDRHNETVSALQMFGVSKEKIIFLGYPDKGTIKLWESNWDLNNPHKGLNGSTFSPYSFSYKKNAPYAGENLVKDLIQIIQKFNPTDIIYPDENDQHNDHWTANAFVQYALAKIKYDVKEWRYLVHLGDYPWPWQYSPDLPLYPPQALKELGMKWAYFPLSTDEELKKYQAIKQYHTQLKVMADFLKGFARKNELLIVNEEMFLPENKTVILKSPVSNKIFEGRYTEAGLEGVIQGATVESLSIKRQQSNLIITLKTKGDIKKEMLYRLNIRFFHDNGVKRLDLGVLNNKLSAALASSESISVPVGSVLSIKNKEISVVMPSDILKGSNSLLLYAETIKKGRKLDKTACLLLHVNK
ncbi:MAG: PIG-L family deacetylase [Desulfitobacteriaceae bacterium]|nr:PIG-L family deacetylase [Desulfitobacteriaceae bacterium]